MAQANDCCDGCAYYKVNHPNPKCANCNKKRCEVVNVVSAKRNSVYSKCKCWMCLQCAYDAMMLYKVKSWNVGKVLECPLCHENIESILNSVYRIAVFEKRTISELVHCNLEDRGRCCHTSDDDEAEDSSYETEE